MERSQIVKPSGGDGRRIVLESSPFDSLPEDCISKIISLTSPRDACIGSSVSKTFKSAAKSDIVWLRFIAPEIRYLIPRSRFHLSKKDLYFSLCDDPVLFDNRGKSFWLEKESGKICIMLSAKKLAITWGDAPEYWTWIQIRESKFETVALLYNVCWLEIRGRTNTRVLSPRTRYSVYIVFKTHEGYGFKDVPIKAEVGVVGQEASRRYVCFDESKDAEDEDAENEYAEDEYAEEEDAEEDAEEEDADEEDAEEEDADEEDAEEEDADEEDAEEEDADEEDAEEEDAEEEERRNLLKPEDRGDGGWMEVELGEFFNEGGLMNSDEIEMSALENKYLNWKQGLIIEGIEIRPAK